MIPTNMKKNNNKTIKTYKCPECGLLYKEKKWVEECEAWCKEHHTCNLEIIKYAVKIEDEDGQKN